MKVGALVLTAGLAAAGGAQAEPAFDAFQKVCVEHHAQRVEALATADAMGWMPIPKPMLKQLSVSAGQTDPDGRMKSDAAGMLFVLVAKTNQIMPSVKIAADVCAVAAAPGDSESLKAAAASYAAVPAMSSPSNPQAVAFFWRNEGGRHAALAPSELAANVGFDVSAMMVGAQGPMALVVLAIPSK